MPLFHNGDDLVLFVHIPKCGGTAVENAFKNTDGWEYGYLNEPKITGYDEKPCNPQHFHKDLIDELIMPTENTTDQITIVRNPYTRLISEFMWRQNVSQYVNTNGFDEQFMNALQTFTIDALRKYKVNESQYLINKKAFIKNKKSFVFDNHMRPQHHFITDDWNIYWFEEMYIKFWPELENKYGVKSIGEVNVMLDSSIERPTTHYNASEEFKDLFTEIYYQDCKMFGYDLPF